MTNVVILRNTFSAETAMARLDRELAEARRSRNEAIRLREQVHKLVCQLEAQIFMLGAVRDSAVRVAGVARGAPDEVKL